MARKTRTVEEWLALLTAKRAEVSDDEIFSLAEFSEILAITAPTLRQIYIDPDPEFPYSQNSDGISYDIYGAKALDRMIARFEAQKNSGEERRARIARLASIRPEVLADDSLSIGEIREIERMMMSIRRMSLEDQGRVDAVEHVRVVSDLCMIVSEDYSSVGPELDAAGLWDESLRAEVREYFATRQVRLHSKFERYLNSDGNGAEGRRARVSRPRKRKASAKRTQVSAG